MDKESSLYQTNSGYLPVLSPGGNREMDRVSPVSTDVKKCSGSGIVRLPGKGVGGCSERLLILTWKEERGTSYENTLRYPCYVVGSRLSRSLRSWRPRTARTDTGRTKTTRVRSQPLLVCDW